MQGRPIEASIAGEGQTRSGIGSWCGSACSRKTNERFKSVGCRVIAKQRPVVIYAAIDGSPVEISVAGKCQTRVGLATCHARRVEVNQRGVVVRSRVVPKRRAVKAGAAARKRSPVQV